MTTAPTPSPPRTLERPIFIAGLAIWAVIGAGLILLRLASPLQARAVASGLVAELAGGREAGIPVALALGANPWFVWPTSFLQDLGTAFVSYPIFLYVLHRYHDSDRYVMRRIRLIEEKAEAHEGYVKRWGPVGIGLFMLVPFLVNGPYIALILGRLAGIRTRELLAPVIVATIVTAAIWTFFFDQLLALLLTVHPQIGWIIAGAAAAVVLSLAAIDFWRDHQRVRSDA